MSAFYASYHSNSWRQQKIGGGQNSEVSNVDQHIADCYQRDPNEDGQWQVPEIKLKENTLYFNRIYILCFIKLFEDLKSIALFSVQFTCINSSGMLPTLSDTLLQIHMRTD